MTRTRRLPSLAVALAATVALVSSACGGSGDGSGAGSGSATDATTATVDASTGVLDVSAPIVGGGQIDLAELAGQPVALWFWAPT